MPEAAILMGDMNFVYRGPEYGSASNPDPGSMAALAARYASGLRFDADAKERELRTEAESWDTSAPVPGHEDDVPLVDVGPWVASGDRADLEVAAADLRRVGGRSGRALAQIRRPASGDPDRGRR